MRMKGGMLLPAKTGKQHMAQPGDSFTLFDFAKSRVRDGVHAMGFAAPVPAMPGPGRIPAARLKSASVRSALCVHEP